MALLKSQKGQAFTIIELLMVVIVFLTLATMSAIFYRSSIGGSYLLTATNELMQNLRRGQQFTTSGYQNSNWGVYFDTSSTPNRYVLFKGSTYASRDTNFDEIYNLPSQITFQTLSLAGGGNEVIFSVPYGETSQTGAVSLRNLEGQTKNVSINSVGRIAVIQGSGGTPQTVSFSASADGHMYKFSPTTNYGSDNKIWIQSWYTSYHERGIIRFNLSSIPQAATVTSATLKLFLYNTQGTVRNYGAHKINPSRDWIESAVTWNRYTASSSWSTAGGDFATTATDTKSAGSWAGTGYWVEWNVTSDVQAFVTNPSNNFGWVIMDSAEGATPQYYVWFASKEYSDATRRPVLEVRYQ